MSHLIVMVILSVVFACCVGVIVHGIVTGRP